MRVTVLDLRRNLKKVLEAIERNETVTLSKRGMEIAIIVPKREARKPLSLKDHPAFGMWKDRDDMKDPSKYIREKRKGRFCDLRH